MVKRSVVFTPEGEPINPFNTEWMQEGACANLPPAEKAYFTSGDAVETRLAKKICNLCCIQEKCLEYALTFSQHGVWAGTGIRERNRIRKQRATDAASSQ